MDSIEHLVVDNEVGASIGGDACGFTFGEDEDSDYVSEGVWQRDDFAQLLVGVARVGVGCDVDLYALIELGGSGFACTLDGVGGIEKVSRYGCVDLAIALAVFFVWACRDVLLVMNGGEGFSRRLVCPCCGRSLR